MQVAEEVREMREALHRAEMVEVVTVETL